MSNYQTAACVRHVIAHAFLEGKPLITHTQANMRSNKMRKAKPAFSPHETWPCAFGNSI